MPRVLLQRMASVVIISLILTIALYPSFHARSDPAAYRTQVRVYTLGTGSWRSFQDFPPRFLLAWSSHFVSGTLNWIAADLTSTVIVSLDLGNESFREISLPEKDGTRPLMRHGYLAVLRDCLGLLECCLEDCSCRTGHGMPHGDLWIMKEYGNAESWTKLFRIPIYEISFFHISLRVLYINEDDQVLITLSEMVFVYNSRNGTFKHPKFAGYSCSRAHPYVESLITPSWY